MFKRFFNWIKSLFLSCLGYDSSALEAEEHEVLPLLVDKDEHEEDIQVERADSTENILVALQEQPVTLSEAEAELILYYGRKGNNEYINKLEPKKKELAYELLNEAVHDTVAEIDNSMRELMKLNATVNREESAWKRVRQYFVRGEASEYSIIPCLENFKTKGISANDPTKDAQINIIDKIISCFTTCKKILNLHLFKQKAHEADKAFAPSKEEIKIELYREETKLNRKTLDAVNDFNKRSDDYWREAEAEEKINPRKYRMGGRK